ncbi:hypothetical protein O181_000347 [Austropuccinia psidii MF-1]|uniref:Uncharacterized protein n=1 Tax=Austropuccinia psidii MF-1 TaxID=1389203 RepID=A0A9Q3GBZ9_9BASI|nr:hypothetical protein [Austropuccinia psidii MF-1]
MELIRGIDMIKEDFELPDRLVTARFNTLFTRSAHRWYIQLTQVHRYQSWTWWKAPILNKWTNDAWRFKVETAFEYAKLNADKDKALPWVCQKKQRLTALYPDMSEVMIQRKILRQCGGDLEHAVKSRTTEKSSAEDIINILEEVTTRPKIGSSRVNIKARFNKPWKSSVGKNPKENSNNMKFKSSDIGKINEIHIEKEPDVEKDDNIIEENSDDKSAIFSESSKDIENINCTFDIMESYSHLPQLSNGQLDLSKIEDAQLMKTKQNREKGYTAGSSCITEMVIENKPTKLLLDPGAFCSCVRKSFLQACAPNFEDQLLPIDGIKFNRASNTMNELEIFETTVIFPHINGNLRITVEFVVIETCSSTHFILGNDYLILYGIDLHDKKERYSTIGDNKRQKFAFLQFKRQIKVRKVAPVNLNLARFKSEQSKEAEISLHMTDKQENKFSSLLYDCREAFSSDKEPLGAIIGHEADIILNIERPYPPLLRRPAYPESPKSREALSIHIK